MGGLHRFRDDGAQFAAEGVEVELVAEACAEVFECACGVVVVAVEGVERVRVGCAGDGKPTPTPQNSHPIALPGRREATTAPTAAHATTIGAKNSGAVGPCAPVGSRTSTSRIAKVTLTGTRATETAHSDQPSREAARELTAPPPKPAARALNSGWTNIATGASSVSLSGNRAVRFGDGTVAVREGALNSGWTNIATGASSVALPTGKRSLFGWPAMVFSFVYVAFVRCYGC